LASCGKLGRAESYEGCSSGSTGSDPVTESLTGDRGGGISSMIRSGTGLDPAGDRQNTNTTTEAAGEDKKWHSRSK
jgi:hypothetical protein